MRTIEYILKKLEELGIEDFFGIRGKYNLNLINIIENNPETSWVNCTNALNAAFASDGYARIKGFGALTTSYGDGELNTISAIFESTKENVPIVHIIGFPHSKQNINNNLEILKNICSTFTYLTKDNAKLEIDRILKILIKERKPVCIAIPEDISEYEITDRETTYDWISDDSILKNVVTKIIEKINASSKPVILSGGLVKRFSSIIEYKEFVSKSAIPVLSFISGLDQNDINSPNYIGLYSSESDYIKESDCCISIGTLEYELNELQTKNSQIIISGNYTNIDGIKYEIKMQELLNCLTKSIEPRHYEFNKQIEGLKNTKTFSDEISFECFCAKFQEFIMENDIIVSDSTIMKKVFSELTFAPNINIESFKTGFGWATPATLGANTAKPNARVILVTDSNSHLISGAEVGTILKNGLKPIIIIINKDISEECIYDLPEVNFTKFARVFGENVWSTQVKTSDDFEKALKVTKIMNKMCYIEVYPKFYNYVETEKDSDNKQIKANSDTKNKAVSLEKISLTSPIKGKKYETIVHRVLNQKNDEAEDV